MTKSVMFRLVNARCVRKKGATHPENVIHESAVPWPKFDELNVMLHSGVEVLR